MVQNLVVSQEVYEHVRSYFENNLKKYVLVNICQRYKGDYIYRVIAYNTKNDNYTVWGSWNELSQTLNHGHYDLDTNTAMRVFLDAGEIVEDQCEIKSIRMKEITEVAIDRMINYDADFAKEILIDDLDMTDDELKYFGTNRAYLENE